MSRLIALFYNNRSKAVALSYNLSHTFDSRLVRLATLNYILATEINNSITDFDEIFISFVLNCFFLNIFIIIVILVNLLKCIEC